MQRCFGVLAIATIGLVAVLAAGEARAAPRRTTPPENRINQELLRLSPEERLPRLAHLVNPWCIGTEAFPMGELTSGPGEGNAYWSLRCADGSTWAVQIDPLAEVTAIDCATFKHAGQGKECFKKF